MDITLQGHRNRILKHIPEINSAASDDAAPPIPPPYTKPPVPQPQQAKPKPAELPPKPKLNKPPPPPPPAQEQQQPKVAVPPPPVAQAPPQPEPEYDLPKRDARQPQPESADQSPYQVVPLATPAQPQPPQGIDAPPQHTTSQAQQQQESTDTGNAVDCGQDDSLAAPTQNEVQYSEELHAQQQTTREQTIDQLDDILGNLENMLGDLDGATTTDADVDAPTAPHATATASTASEATYGEPGDVDSDDDDGMPVDSSAEHLQHAAMLSSESDSASCIHSCSRAAFQTVSKSRLGCAHPHSINVCFCGRHAGR